MSENDDPASFERAFRDLQETISLLESGGLTLQQSIETFERGIALANRCTTILEQAELRVSRVIESHQVPSDDPAS